jgi:hypothetical protein
MWGRLLRVVAVIAIAGIAIGTIFLSNWRISRLASRSHMIIHKTQPIMLTANKIGPPKSGSYLTGSTDTGSGLTRHVDYSYRWFHGNLVGELPSDSGRLLKSTRAIWSVPSEPQRWPPKPPNRAPPLRSEVSTHCL